MNVTASAFTAFVTILVVAPAVQGIATRTRAVLTGRRGAPVLQLYFDLWKLVRRGAVYSRATTGVFQAAPVIALATSLVAAALVPLDAHAALFRFSGDAVAFAATLALGRLALVLGAFDTGSSFEGMGASREVTFATVVEGGLFLVFLAAGVVVGASSLTAMFGDALAPRWAGAAPSLVMVSASLFALMLAECGRVPVDDPATHLELTMIHEVIVLDHSGPDLALILYAGALKLALLGSLVVGIAVPRGALAPAVALAALVAGLAAVAVAVGVVESVMARLRLPRVPLYIAGSASLALIGLALVLR